MPGTTTFIYMGDPQWDKFTGPRYDYSQWGRLLRKAYEMAFGESPGENHAGEESKRPLLVLGGDIVNRRNRPEEWDGFYAAGGGMLRSMRVISAMGNRGYAPAEEYRRRFDMPDNGPAGAEGLFCSLDHGSCHFLILDTNRIGAESSDRGAPVDLRSLQEWIRQDLEQNKQPATFVLMHHPVLTVGTSAEDEARAAYMRTHLLPLFEEYPVDMILCGHQHLYCRSYPILSGRTQEQTDREGQAGPSEPSDQAGPSEMNDPGLIQIMGVSGTKLFDAWEPSGMACIREYVSNATLVTAGEGQVRLTTIDPEGNVLDELIRPLRKGRADNTKNGKLQ